MKTIYDPTLKATVTLDDAGQIRGVNHLDEYREIEHRSGRAAATAYVRDIAEKLNITPEALRSLEQRISYLDPQPQDVEYRFSEEKVAFDSATYAYYQTYLNTPVWAAGVTATVKQAPARVVAATNTSENGIDAKMPATEAIERYRQLFATGEKVDGPAVRLDDLRLPTGNRLEKLKRDRDGQYSIRVNDRWRVCFRWGGSDAFDVEIVDYH